MLQVEALLDLYQVPHEEPGHCVRDFRVLVEAPLPHLHELLEIGCVPLSIQGPQPREGPPCLARIVAQTRELGDALVEPGRWTPHRLVQEDVSELVAERSLEVALIEDGNLVLAVQAPAILPCGGLEHRSEHDVARVLDRTTLAIELAARRQ